MILSPIATVLDCKLTFVDEPNICKFPDTNKSPPNDVIEPEPTVNAPVTLVLPWIFVVPVTTKFELTVTFVPLSTTLESTNVIVAPVELNLPI